MAAMLKTCRALVENKNSNNCACFKGPSDVTWGLIVLAKWQPILRAADNAEPLYLIVALGTKLLNF